MIESPSQGVSPGHRCLVVGYDGSTGARQAANWAVHQLAPGGQLILLYACGSQRGALTPPALPSHPSYRRRLGRALLDELLLDGDPLLIDLGAEVEIADGPPAVSLIQVAARRGADAIVVGSRHSRLAPALSASVSRELLQNADRPVFVVPDGAPISARLRAAP